jgi:DNA-binding NarL/FixJ family response regulator
MCRCGCVDSAVLIRPMSEPHSEIAGTIETVETNSGVHLKVLLIDDDPGVHEVLKSIIRMPPPAEVELVSALTFDEGLRIVRDEYLDLVLLDLNLSETMRAPQTIMAMDGMCAKVPLLVITDHQEESAWRPGRQWRESSEHGALNYLPKSVYLDPRNRLFLLRAFTNAIFEFRYRVKLRGHS